MKGYITTKELADRLGISSARIRQLITAGVIRGAEKFGRDNFIPESEAARIERLERKPGRPASKPKQPK